MSFPFSRLRRSEVSTQRGGGERGHKNRLGGMTNEEHKMSAFSPFPNLTIGKNLLRKTAVGSVCVPFHCGIARIIGGRQAAKISSFASPHKSQHPPLLFSLAVAGGSKQKERNSL